VVRAVRSNFGLKIIALAVAIVGWAYFRFAAGPLVASSFNQQLSVPITAVNLAPGYIARFNDKTAVVTIAPKPGEPPIKAEEVKAVIDLSNRAPGVYNVPIQLVAPAVAVQSLSPASITLTIERIDSHLFPVAMHYAGEGDVVVRRFSLSPSQVTVSGPSSQLSQVAAVRVDLPLGNAAGSFSAMIRPLPIDSSGNQIEDLQTAPNLIRVQAQFTKAVH
jgi:YbbR domain-containing protein